MKYKFSFVATTLVCCSYGQEFEVASIKPVESTGFFHASDAASGGPGSADPATFRCTCALSSLITRAFGLQKYQFPGQQALPRDSFSVWAKVPEGTTPEQFRVMLQNLLKSRFELAYHFDKKEIQGYQLTIAKSGSKLKESQGAGGSAGEHSGHGGLLFTSSGFGYRADHRTSGQIAQILSDQMAKPVEDQTGLKGAYDVALSWSGESAHDHQPGAPGGGGWDGPGHGDHGGGGGAADSAPGPTLFDAVQSQLGLKLVAAKKANTQVFVVDHINKVPSGN